MSQAYESLVAAERLLADPAQARLAALDALRALLEEWSVEPRGDSVVGLLEQAAETDQTLLDFRAEAAVLDRFPDEPDAAERAKIFVDAARARMVNI
ncbi:MAG: hypothetical protein JOZ81_16230 [Chloroflexi bacterium]|nr:hypothetical protein [Chloroflexota bacterium]